MSGNAAGRRTRLARSPTFRVGAALVLALAAFSLLGPVLLARDPFESDFVRGVDAATGLPVGPCAAFPLGADRIFRDVLSRLAWGGRLSLTIAVGATGVATLLGALVGVVAGYHEGRAVPLPWPAAAGLALGGVAALLGHPGLGAGVLGIGIVSAFARPFPGPSIDLDAWLMRFVDVMLAFPFLILVMAIAAALQRTSAVTTFVTLGLTGWLGTARLVRARTMQVRDLEFVVASRALGQSTFRVVMRHIVPGLFGPLVVVGTIQVAQMIVADSVLSFLGMGVAPPAPTWGRMLFEGQDFYASAPWQVLAPGVAILLSVWGFHLLGEGLRDALDPREA